jgi:hypothetical protein
MKKVTTSIYIFLIFITSLSAQIQLGSDIDGPVANYFFGSSTDISYDGNTLISGNIGASSILTNAGEAQVLDWNGTGWVSRGFSIGGEASSDFSGHSVAINKDGNTVAITSIYNSAAGYYYGHVRIFDWSGVVWVQRGIDIDGLQGRNFFGFDCALSADGNRFVAGGIENNINLSNSGFARVYEWSNSSSTWVQLGGDINGAVVDDNFGRSVDMSANGNRIIIGATRHDFNGTNSGQVQVYDWNGTAWVQVGQNINGANAGDYFGGSTSISKDGQRIAIGAFNDSLLISGGYIEVYELIGNSWLQIGSTVLGSAIRLQFGYDVDLNYDGSRLAVSQRFNSNIANTAGSARIFDLINNSWIKVGQDIYGEAASDRFGHAIALDSSGNRIAITAPDNSANGNRSGHLRVFNLNNLVGVEKLKTPSSIAVYPNPFQESFIISLENNRSGLASILDIKGSLVYSKEFNSSSTLRIQPSVPPGFYLMQIQFENGEKEVFKVVKD